MRSIRFALMAIALGAIANCAAYSQPPGYGQPEPPPPPDYGYGYGPGSQPGYGSGYEGGPQVDVGFFYDELSPYGDWVHTPEYGWAWFPRDVAPYWRPYSDGRWVQSDYGWTWVSFEPFGWATYHYGRWVLDRRFGWLWIPGTEWGPAWVAWQAGDGYVGWAPLPPEVGFEVGVGLRLGGLDLSVVIRPEAYNFVSVREFLAPRLSVYLLPAPRNITIIHYTRNVTDYGYVGGRVYDRGYDPRRFEQETGRRVPSYRFRDSQERRRGEVSGGEVRIYRPDRRALESVHAGRRDEERAGSRESYRPPSPGRTAPAAPDIVVAPRVNVTSHPDERQIQQRDQRQHEQLDRYLSSERQKLDRAHQQDLARAKDAAERQRVDERHQAEMQALQEQQRVAAQQLEARQRAMQQAQAASQAAHGNARAEQAKKQAEERAKKNKGKQKGKPEPPPPFRRF
jgi:hypothetical protein